METLFAERPSRVVEEYLQVILALSGDAGRVKAVQLTERLQTSPSTVHSTLSRMQRDGLVQVDAKKSITLTDSGREQATGIARRHRLVETFLCDYLGIPWHEVHHHAHVLEHGLTPLVEDRLFEFLQHPQTCPHGTPFPGQKHVLPPGMRPLSLLAPGQEFEVVVVDESLEDDQDLMKYLWEQNIKPRARHRLLAINEIAQILELSAPEGDSRLPLSIAPKIGVLPL